MSFIKSMGCRLFYKEIVKRDVKPFVQTRQEGKPIKKLSDCHLWTLALSPLDVDVAMSGRRHCLGWTNFVPFINRRKEGIDILSSVFYFVPLSYGKVT